MILKEKKEEFELDHTVQQKGKHHWDINDHTLPTHMKPDVYTEWPKDNCKYMYSENFDKARRHSSGWAMRNTNNHNVNILKKSCVGVLVCTLRCHTPTGKQVHMKPAICDKARQKQLDKPCPNPCCRGSLELMPCRGHCGFPVTHFWRHGPGFVYFQAKGIHDHPRPELKSSCEARRYLSSDKEIGSLPKRGRSRNGTPITPPVDQVLPVITSVTTTSHHYRSKEGHCTSTTRRGTKRKISEDHSLLCTGRRAKRVSTTPPIDGALPEGPTLSPPSYPTAAKIPYLMGGQACADMVIPAYSSPPGATLSHNASPVSSYASMVSGSVSQMPVTQTSQTSPLATMETHSNSLVSSYPCPPATILPLHTLPDSASDDVVPHDKPTTMSHNSSFDTSLQHAIIGALEFTNTGHFVSRDLDWTSL